MMNKLIVISLTWYLSACVETLVVDLDTGEESAAGTKTNYEGGTAIGGEPIDTGGETVITGPERLTCNVGEALDLCVVCGPNNDEQVAMNDDRCEPIDCAPLNNYRIFTHDDGRQECRKRPYLPGPAICQGQGACYTDPMRYCELQLEETVLESDEIGECFELTGCEGQTEHSLVPTPGETCLQGLGVCDEAGECIAERSCITLFNFEYNNENRLCSDRLTTENYCEFYVVAEDGPWGERMSCDQFCGDMGGSCLKAWGEKDDSCDKKDEEDCSDDFGDGICRCAPAPM